MEVKERKEYILSRSLLVRLSYALSIIIYCQHTLSICNLDFVISKLTNTCSNRNVN